MGAERLQKLLSECGVASRRKAEEMILEGRVKVNGRLAGLGDKADLKRDIVTVDGKRIHSPERLVYIMLHKPRGYVTTMNDEKGRRCVADLVKNVGSGFSLWAGLTGIRKGFCFLPTMGILQTPSSTPQGIFQKYTV